MAYVPRSQRKETEIQELFKELHEITEKQDIINLKIRELINDSKDPRWLPIHIIDNANALILEISRHEGSLGNRAYIDEKADGIQTKLFQLRFSKPQT